MNLSRREEATSSYKRQRSAVMAALDPIVTVARCVGSQVTNVRRIGVRA